LQIREGVINGGYDLLFRGWPCDVKYTRHPDPCLMCPPRYADRDTEVYILFKGTDWRYQCHGWAFAHQLFDPAHEADVGHGPCYKMPATELNPLPLLLAL
jgi:hypothetical protein